MHGPTMLSDRGELLLPDGRTLSLSWAAISDVGLIRAVNEDSLVAQPALFAVADGMGGHSAGDFASQTVARRLHEIAAPVALDTDHIEAALAVATEDILRVGEFTVRGVGTTVTGMALSTRDGEPCWMVFNIGDSRCYLATNEEPVRLTTDHSLVQEMVDSGMISAEEAEDHPDSNVITRAVGFELNPRPDFGFVTLVAGSRFLICTDGLTKELADSEIGTVLSTAPEAEEAAARLVDMALARQGRDNVTVVVVDVDDITSSDDSL